jgi:hypothetical protein
MANALRHGRGHSFIRGTSRGTSSHSPPGVEPTAWPWDRDLGLRLPTEPPTHINSCGAGLHEKRAWSMVRLKRDTAGRLRVIALLIGLVFALMTGSATAKTLYCPSFSVPRTYTPTDEVTFSFSRIRATGVSCRKTGELITSYLFGKGHPAGPSPADGSTIEGWNVLVLAATATGHKGHAHFSAVYE